MPPLTISTIRPSSILMIAVGIFEDPGVVGDNQDAAVFVQEVFFDKADDSSAGDPVQGRGGFIENQNVRAADDGPGQGHALLFAAAQLDGRERGPVLEPTTSRNSMAGSRDSSQSCLLRIRGRATFSAVVSFGNRW